MTILTTEEFNEFAEGVARGYRRAYKHTDAPTDEAVINTIQECVPSSFYEYFDFDN